jgi:CubicO group peptidase (beta-lactamase class C family)
METMMPEDEGPEGTTDNAGGRAGDRHLHSDISGVAAAGVRLVGKCCDDSVMEANLADAMSAACGADATRLVVGVLTGADRLIQTSRGTDPCTPAYGASLAKPVTAACVALLVRAGDLDPDETVSRYLPDLPGWADQVRLTHLVHHCSGLPADATSFDPSSDEAWTTAQAIATLMGIDGLSRGPGDAFEYDGHGYVLLSKVVEAVTGSPFVEFAQQHVFNVLAMSSTTFFNGPERQPASAVPILPGVAAPLSIGDGGLWTTVEDLLTWADAMIHDDLGIIGILKQQFTLNDGTVGDYCWGIRRRLVGQHEVFSHGGSWPGVANKLIWTRQPPAAVAIMSARPETHVLRLADDLLDQLLT